MNAATRPDQMTLEVGEQPEDMPIAGTVAIAPFPAPVELHKRDEVTVTIADADGQVIASGIGRVVGINFKDHDATQRAPAWTERVHAV
jgi:hypothetical protein